MKLERLIGILSILQKGGQVTAPELAARFEVSRRTISRDIEELCRAGLPVVTTQGAGGGISFLPNGLIDTAILTEEELRLLFAGLETIDSISKKSHTRMLSGKLSKDGSVYAGDGEISIDLASFYRERLAEKIDLLRRAIREHREICFRYYYDKGEACFHAEPYRILFRWSDWYLLAYTKEREAFRLYKLHRMWEITEEETFPPREVPQEELDVVRRIRDDYRTTAIYAPAARYRIIEEYGPHAMEALPDGRFRFSCGFMSQEKAVAWYLGFGNQVEVVEPEDLREELRRVLSNMLAKYSEEQDR
ncbi:MAG: YafY family transcriptional regulator [Ruminococcaceae bacterium]|nr:YafY family transcriptional regulator [Oscillospiraceae bacterium]